MHAPDSPADEAGPTLHPWRLFAVNVEDDARRVGLQIGRDPATKPLLASFIGAHADHYLSDVRLRLGTLASEPGFHVETTVGWHFEGVVYGHQVKGEPIDGSYRIDDSVAHYNQVLSDSVFSLCPTGAGPNTLRLWESLAVGAVPVLLGPPPRLPEGGTLPPIDWDAIVLRVANGEIARLPEILRGISIDEIRRRQLVCPHCRLDGLIDVEKLVETDDFKNPCNLEIWGGNFDIAPFFFALGQGQAAGLVLLMGMGQSSKRA